MNTTLNLEEELRRPETRKACQAYANAEIARMDGAVYTPLEHRYPSLQAALALVRQGYDPVAKMEQLKISMLAIEATKGMVRLYHKFSEQEPNTAVKSMMKNVDALVALYERFAPVQKQFYAQMARAINVVSTRNGITLDEAVREPKYFDSVHRKVFPTRAEAESYMETSMQLESGLMDAMRDILAIPKKQDAETAETLKKIKLLPTKKAVEVLQAATREYRSREFDRIYSG